MQVFLKFPEKLQKSTEESSFIILEFQGKIESFQEELDFLELGEITHSSDNVFLIIIFDKIMFIT